MAELRRSCHHCNGDGIIENPPPGGDNTCAVCGGSGRLPTTIQVDTLMSEFDDIKDRVNDVIDKCNDILEAIQNP